MDRPQKRSHPTAESVGGRRERSPKRIGFIGRSTITEEEGATLVLLGRALARLGHTFVSVPTEGATAKVREGVEVEKGDILDLQNGVLETADNTLLYPSPQLLSRVREKYPDMETRYRVTILQPHQLKAFWGAMTQIMAEQGIEVPV